MPNSSEIENSDSQLESHQLEQRQDLVLQQLDDLNERIENLIDLYTRLRKEDRGEEAVPCAAQGVAATDSEGSVSKPTEHPGDSDQSHDDQKRAA